MYILIRWVLLPCMLAFALTGFECAATTIKPTDQVAPVDSSPTAPLPARLDDCVSSLQNKAQISAKVAAEAKAANTHPGMSQRDGAILTIFSAGQPVASFKACDIYFWGVLDLINPLTHRVQTYPVVTVGFAWHQSVIVQPDGNLIVFDGDVLASPDHRYVASGDTYSYYNNENLRITDWISSKHSSVIFDVECSPLAWTLAQGLHVTCNRTNAVYAFSDAKVVQTRGGWTLIATRLTSLMPDPKTSDDWSAEFRLKNVRRFKSRPLKPKDGPDSVYDNSDGSYKRLYPPH